MSPQLKSVEVSGRHNLSIKNTPNRIAPSDFFAQVQRVKEAFAQTINASEVDRIAVIPSVSYGIATVAKNLPLTADQEIITAADQFPSNYYSWQELCRERNAKVVTVGVEEGADKGRRWNEAILAAIKPQTAAVALSHVHWAEGVLFDLEKIREKTRAVGAWLIIDGTQSVGALPFDVQKIQPDALICAAYKWLMGPYSSGVAYYGPVMDGGRPIEENWINRKDSHDFRNLINYQSEYQPLAGRYCMGEQSNFILMPMLEAALQQINAWQPARIQEYCAALNAPYLAELRERGFQMLPEDQRAHHLVGVRLPEGVAMEQVQAALAEAKVLVSVRGSSIRLAPNVYNHATDWERLMTVLRKFTIREQI
jgi:selenocysteine lyase/cysteine desulfurase